MANHNVSRAMSTQHPDNVSNPFFTDNAEISGDDEIKEAFYAYSHIGCKEQLWDCEGKEADNFVVKKLLSRYEGYFNSNVLGKDVFLTLRVPNPSVEKNEAKILLETLESIPRSFDTAKVFYGKDIAPIFEIALPMTTDHKELLRISKYYSQYVVGKQHQKVADMKISDWTGNFSPDNIRVIPLIEDKESILNSDKIVEDFLMEEKASDYQRVWLARSDPALNYGNLGTVLMLKIALQKLWDLKKKLSIDLLPILGCGSVPFRGNFKPGNISGFLKSYPSIHTFTLQSSFKYDHPISEVRKAVDALENAKTSSPTQVDEKKCAAIIEKLEKEYQRQVSLLAGQITSMSPYIPKRRKRKLHIGLFGYSRNISGMKLPRAITFCACLYSYGLPPEILGLNALDAKDLDYVRQIYFNFDSDLKDALQYLNEDNMHMFPNEVTRHIRNITSMTDYETDRKHKKVTSIIADNLKDRDYATLSENITRAGFIRGFLG